MKKCVYCGHPAGFLEWLDEEHGDVDVCGCCYAKSVTDTGDSYVDELRAYCPDPAPK